MEAVGILIALVGCIVLMLGTLVVLGAVRAARAVSAKAENVALKARAYTNPGAPGRIASVRLRLRNSLAGTHQALDAAAAQDAQVGESQALLKRLDELAADLDGQLRMLEHEPDAARVDAKLPELRERAQRITHAAEELRWAVQDRQHRFADDELERLSAECSQEADALRHWSEPVTAEEATHEEPKRLGAARWPTAEEVLGLVDRIRKPSGEAR